MADDTINVNDDTSNIEPVVPAGETHEQRASRLEEANKKLYQRAKEAESLAKELKLKAQEEANKAKPTISESKGEFKPSDILKVGDVVMAGPIIDEQKKLLDAADQLEAVENHARWPRAGAGK